MEAATLEQSSGDTSPVFVAGGRHRSHAVRLAAATLGLLLAGWLAALVAGLVGFSPLPELTFPGTGAARAPAAAPEQGSRPAVERDAGTQASPVASRRGAGRRPGECGRECRRERRAPRLGQRGGSRFGPGRGRRYRDDLAGRRGRRRRRRRPPAAPRARRAPGTRRRSRRPPAGRRAPARRGATPPTPREARSPPIRPAGQRARTRAEASRLRPVRIEIMAP